MAEDKKPHFDVSAAVIRQLGEELVTDEVTAIMELIKNSYDADADWVKVEVNLIDSYPNENKFYKDSRLGYVLIEDNGFGMSENDIWDRWMKISLSFKKKFKEEGNATPKGRTPLGEKGVGRLSTQRLGARLEMFTGQSNASRNNHVAFDWDQFDEDTSLTSVPVHIDSFPKRLSETGTTLIITNLKETNKWKGEAWDRFRGQISQMIFPFKEKRIFEVYLKLNGFSVDLDEVNQKVRDNSVAQYSFSLIDDKIVLNGQIKLQKLSGGNKRDDLIFFENRILPDGGRDFFDFLTDRKANRQYFVPDLKYSNLPGGFLEFKRETNFSDLSKISYIETDEIEVNNSDFNEELSNENEFDEVLSQKIEIANPGNFEGEINDFNFKDSQEIESAFDSLSEFKRLVQNQVGVRVFRDGFGIKPYGVGGHDWLKLSDNQTSGGSFYGLRPGNVVGYVIISAKNNKDLKEKTDREGFVDSPYSRNFFRIMDYFVYEINTILESTRRSYNSYRASLAQSSAGIQNISDSFSKLRDTSDKAKKSSSRALTVRYNLANISNQIKEVSSKRTANGTQDASTNLLLDNLTNVLEEAELLLTEVESILNDAKVLDQHVEFLQPQIQNLEQQLSDFSELAGLGLTAEALSHELSNIVDRLIEETEKISQKLKLKIDLDQGVFKIYIEQVRSASRSFKKQLSHLAPSLRYVRETKESIAIQTFLDEIESYYKERFKGQINLRVEIHSNNFTLLMNKGKLTQIVDNIILNSEYWLLEKKRGNGQFSPLITIEAQEPFIRIFDNGNGVETNIQEQIFQPFVTAKPKTVGRGLGLFIVQQLLESVGCEMILLNKKNDYGRRYIFQMNMAAVVEK